MSAILGRIREVEVQNYFILYLYIGLANQHEEYGKGGGDTQQFGNVQESERYIIHVSSTKKDIGTTTECCMKPENKILLK